MVAILFVASAMALLLHLAIAIILVRRFLLTREVGFLWLGGAVVIWPLISSVLEAGKRVLVDRIVRHEWVSFYPFTLVERGQISLGEVMTSLALLQQLIGVCLLLVAVFYLSKIKNSSLHPAG
jgi:hypothetical protein